MELKVKKVRYAIVYLTNNESYAAGENDTFFRSSLSQYELPQFGRGVNIRHIQNLKD